MAKKSWIERNKRKQKTVEKYAAIRAALKAYRDPKVWHTIQANGMAKDYSWKASAAAYVTLYEAAKRARIPRVAGSSK